MNTAALSPPTALAAAQPLPKGPVLGWRSWAGTWAADVPALDDLPHQCATTSGRAAIALALRELGLPPGSPVLIPSYHCPTMPAAVVHAGCMPVFYALDEQLHPEWARMPTPSGPGALLVPHYFGLGRSLHRERQWCDTQGWALIEDCAHTWFGHAGSRPVGHWGDFAVGSTTKFFPVREGGLLASAHRPCPAPQAKLQAGGMAADVRTALGLLAASHRHARLAPLSTLPGWLERATNRAAAPATASAQPQPSAGHQPACDMARIQRQAWRSSEWLRRALPRGRVVLGRRTVARRLGQAVNHMLHAQVWGGLPATDSTVVPYALPLWMNQAERADAAYHALRSQGIPVFRWDVRWPGAAELGSDAGARASRHLLQLPTHPDYSEAELQRITRALQRCTGA